MSSAPPRVVLLTSSELRHKYVASVLAESLDLAGVVVETKRPKPGIAQAESDEDLALLKRHFAARDTAEAKYFAGAEYPDADVLRIDTGQVNDDETVTWIAAKRPDYVLLYGTGIVREPILGPWDGRVINMHLGLSPYYKGAGTNLWPLCNGEPECVGVTVHVAVPAVDAGPILVQGRPRALAPDDDAHDIGCKAILAGADLYARATVAFASGGILPVEQHSGGRVYRARDFDAGALRQLERNLAAGMVPDYLADALARNARCPIVEG